MNSFIDLHTHNQDQKDGVITVYNHLLHRGSEVPSNLFSAGLHPWYADQLSTGELTKSLNQLIDDKNLVAFGETGLDKVCNIPMKLQLDVFTLHLEIAAKYRIPVIIHCVKAWDELIETCSNYKTINILHGFNGSIKLTDRLLQHEFHFSIGKGIMYPNSKIQSAISLIPLNSLFCETDDSEISIQSVYKRVSEKLQVETEEFKSMLFRNFAKLISELK